MGSGNWLADQGEKDWDERHTERCEACKSTRLEEIEFCEEYNDTCHPDNCDLPKNICPGMVIKKQCYDCGYINRY